MNFFKNITDYFSFGDGKRTICWGNNGAIKKEFSRINDLLEGFDKPGIMFVFNIGIQIYRDDKVEDEQKNGFAQPSHNYLINIKDAGL